MKGALGKTGGAASAVKGGLGKTAGSGTFIEGRSIGPKTSSPSLSKSLSAPGAVTIGPAGVPGALLGTSTGTIGAVVVPSKAGVPISKFGVPMFDA